MSQLTVRTMSKLSGVSAHTLRAWEKRYGALKPSRTDGGQRAYNMSDLERLRCLKALTELGFSIGQIARLPNEELVKMGEEHKRSVKEAARGRSERDTRSPHLLPGLQVSQLPEISHEPRTLSKHNFESYDREPIEGLINELAEFRLDEVYRILVAARMRYGARDFVLKIVAPVIYEIGVLVQTGSMSIAQEHAFSALLRDQLGLLIQSSRPAAAKDSIVFATSEGDLHEFGILLGQVLSLSHGLQCHNLGPNLPVESLIFATEALRADHIVLGFSELPQGMLKMSIADYVKALRKGVSKQTTIMVGGGGLTHEIVEQIHDHAIYVESLFEFDNILKRIATHRQ